MTNSPLIANIEMINVDDLNLNMLELSLSQLYYVSWRILNNMNFFETYQIPMDIWQEFIWKMERKYDKRNNSFHNFYHAVTGI